MKQYFAYTRVSTVRQGEHGVSLQEQKSEIERYARQKGMVVSEWFEERETAAKLGRAVFTQMMKRLRNGEAAGVVIHKIDRSARNLRDWADIGQLTDDGIEVHFTREAIDMQSSSGRLSADVQAVVAANYVRNLREETIKGFYGRLKQGLYPMQAPLGYLDQGGGKAKTIDSARGPLVREAFRLYASKKYSQAALVAEMAHRGLRTKKGEMVSKNTIAGILSNPFYYGLIRIRKGEKTFAGAHEPLIPRKLFDQVQEILHGRSVRSTPKRKQFLYSRLLKCGCGRSLIGELQKGHTYYRCHKGECAGTSIREEEVGTLIADLLRGLEIRPQEIKDLDCYVEEKRSSANTVDHGRVAAAERRLDAIANRLNRLTDALVDGHVDGSIYEERKKTLLSERLECEAELRELQSNPGGHMKRLEEFVELAKSACLLFKHGDPEQKREIVQLALSNRTLRGKTPDFTLVSELSDIADRPTDQNGAPTSSTRRRGQAASRHKLRHCGSGQNGAPTSSTRRRGQTASRHKLRHSGSGQSGAPTSSTSRRGQAASRHKLRHRGSGQNGAKRAGTRRTFWEEWIDGVLDRADAGRSKSMTRTKPCYARLSRSRPQNARKS